MAAIIAENPDSFIKKCGKKLPKEAFKFIERTPVIDPSWDYEEIIEEMSIKIWECRT